MDYTKAIDYLDALTGLGSDLGLGRMEKLMAKLGNPELTIPTIHVAGTNGKGSACAMLSNILIKEGYRVGVYTSPHLENYNERYTINNKRIGDEKFAGYLTRIADKCEELKKEGVSQPTVFEVVTALCFLYFAEQKVDFLLLEVGLGGRFDATNVVREPVLSLITSISKDHVDYLGDSIRQIAFEKGGIIKQDRPVVLYRQDEEAVEVIRGLAQERNSRLYYADKEEIQVQRQDLSGTVFYIKNDYLEYPDIQVGLLGEHQVFNSALVLLACKALRDLDIKISDQAIYDGLRDTKWSGRMEIVGENPLVMIDGAHNVAGIQMLAKSLKDYFSHKKITLLIGILGDKEYDLMIDLLLPLADKIVLTEPNNSRTWDVDTLSATIARFNVETHREKDIEKAFALAKDITSTEDVVCCAGSLYLIGEIYKLARR